MTSEKMPADWALKGAVDRKLLCAREAAFQAYYAAENFTLADAANDGIADSDPAVVACVSAITLWEEGFGG